MTSDQWAELLEFQKKLRSHYPGDQFRPLLTRAVIDDLVDCFADALASGDVTLVDEPPDEGSEGFSVGDVLHREELARRLK